MENVLFEVGGEVFCTTVTELNRYPSSLLPNMCRDCPDAVGCEKPIQINRTREGFRWILDIYRNGSKTECLPMCWTLQEMESELDFYQLPKWKDLFVPIPGILMWKLHENYLMDLANPMLEYITNNADNLVATTCARFVIWYPASSPRNKSVFAVEQIGGKNGRQVNIQTFNRQFYIKYRQNFNEQIRCLSLSDRDVEFLCAYMKKFGYKLRQESLEIVTSCSIVVASLFSVKWDHHPNDV